MIKQILSNTGLDSKCLQLELTESTIMQDSESNIIKLKELQAIGVKTAIDDFGTGYSSLKYLKNFPISTLKIDQSFVKDLTTNPNDQSIVKAIINMAHNFNLKIIAEGVETKEQMAYLRKCGCEGLQGYLICPPVNSIALAQFIKNRVFNISE